MRAVSTSAILGPLAAIAILAGCVYEPAGYGYGPSYGPSYGYAPSYGYQPSYNFSFGYYGGDGGYGGWHHHHYGYDRW